MATQIAENVSQSGRSEMVGLRSVGPGVSHGMLDGFPTYLIDLQAVPFTPQTIPLHMVATGRQERALVEYIVEHYRHHPSELDLVQHLHVFAMMEVLMLHGLTPEQIGIDEDALARLISLSKRPMKYFRYVGSEELAQGLFERLGAEKVAQGLIERLSAEQVAQSLVELLGAEKARELIERLAKKPPSSEAPPPSGN